MRAHRASSGWVGSSEAGEEAAEAGAGSAGAGGAAAGACCCAGRAAGAAAGDRGAPVAGGVAEQLQRRGEEAAAPLGLPFLGGTAAV
ncbi:hypothetical protein, partial [Streptomyces actinomycinicus]|uniref:hypothetical protein n=1 Tax=Streptomyces actinomycinicus TaxID=1695166 RepID=UPI0036D959F0